MYEISNEIIGKDLPIPTLLYLTYRTEYSVPYLHTEYSQINRHFHGEEFGIMA